jgi:hypothetical protein
MPDGTVVEDREERFHFNAAAAREYFAENGDLLPPKDARPRGVNLYQWLKNQELQIASGTLRPDRAAVLNELPGWRDRQLQRTLGSARQRTRRGPRHTNRGEALIGEGPQSHATSFAGDGDEDLPDNLA